MADDRRKNASQWFYSNLFRDEPIRPRQSQPEAKIPALLRAARSLESGTGASWQSREQVFLKQGKLLASFEDHYPCDCNAVRYYPTYQSFTDRELRGYFTWRTKLRGGDVRKTTLSFAFLYIYELLNQIGVSDPMEGYRKLISFSQTYGALDQSILPYLKTWITDYVVYYGLDASLLGSLPQVVFDRSVTVLENVRHQEPAKVMYAVKALSAKWLERSKFYGEFAPDCDTVIVRVLRRVWDHYATRCKKTMVEQYFGRCAEFQYRPFQAAVFAFPRQEPDREYVLDERCVYRCRGGLWTVWKHASPHRPSTELGDLLKTVDSVMREEYGYGHPIKPGTETKWLMKIIREETRGFLAEKKAAEAKKIRVDLSRLADIRRDAAVTRDRLMVEEELEPPAAEEVPAVVEEAAPAIPEGTALSPPEYRLLQCLLYGKDLSWVQQQGHLLSVLVDGINEKLYDTFMDLVLDDTPELTEDYIEDLKEMVRP